MQEDFWDIGVRGPTGAGRGCGLPGHGEGHQRCTTTSDVQCVLWAGSASVSWDRRYCTMCFSLADDRLGAAAPPWSLLPGPVEHSGLHCGQWGPGGLCLLVSNHACSRSGGCRPRTVVGLGEKEGQTPVGHSGSSVPAHVAPPCLPAWAGLCEVSRSKAYLSPIQPGVWN